MTTAEGPNDEVKIPTPIVKRVRNGECILFLGAMASAAVPPAKSSFAAYTERPPGGEQLSLKLAELCQYPYEDKTNLQRVSLFYQSLNDEGGRNEMVKAIFAEVGALTIKPSPALRMLSELPFRIIITTNYDKLFEKALRHPLRQWGPQKEPIVTVYDPLRNRTPEHVPVDPTVERPILLKLHGDIDVPTSVVVTEEDYITFIQRMGNQHLHPIHDNIRVRMREWPVLFIGYSLRDYNLRLLFKTLRWELEPVEYPISFSVDPYPDNLIVSVWQEGKPPMVSFVREDLWRFVPALYKAVTGKEYKYKRHDES